MIRDIVVYPDKRLKLVSKEVFEFDKELHILLDDMYDTMTAKNGIGLAAIQVGIDLQVLLINLVREDEKQYKEDLIEVINPKILEKDGEIVYQEGCLSVPGFYDDVKRAEHIKVSFLDRDGKEHIKEYKDLMAIALSQWIQILGK